jgi:hypothetical protein
MAGTARLAPANTTIDAISFLMISSLSGTGISWAGRDVHKYSRKTIQRDDRIKRSISAMNAK